LKETAYLLSGFMDSWCDNMGRCFAGQLDDIFTQVGFDRLDTSGSKGAVESDFFLQHGFALDRHADLMFPGDV